MTRWAITHTATFKDLVGQTSEVTAFYKHEAGGFFNIFGRADEAKTWRTKAEAVNYLRRHFGRRPGRDGYDVVQATGL